MKSVLKKSLLLLLLLLAIGTLGSYLYFRYQIDHMLGGNTEPVDSSQFQAISGSLAISSVNVLAADSSTFLQDQTVLIEDHQIVSVSSDATIPPGFHHINGEGKYLIPGLIDSHVHLKKSRNDLLLYIANGVTQVGEMTGMDHHFDLIEDLENGQLGPGVYLASPKLSSQNSWKATFRSVFEGRHKNYLTPEDARFAVRDHKSKGYEAIKLSSDLRKDIYAAINQEAQKLNIPVIGHLPVGLTLEDLYQSGQSQLSHIDSIILALVNEQGGLYVNNSREQNQQFLQKIQTLADPVARRMKQHNIALSSTVWLHQTRMQQAYELPEFLKSIPLEYQNPGWLEGSSVSKGCLPSGNSYQFHAGDSEQKRKEVLEYLQTYNQAIKIITQALIKQGVTVTAGTDALGACGMIAGFSLHKELETLHEYGLTPSQVLQSATAVPARWMGVNSGVIEKGYRADLVLLNQNPLDDISHTQSIESVIVNGKYLNRMQLDDILRKVKEANNNSRKVSIDLYLN